MFKKNLESVKRNYYSDFDRSKFICFDANERPFDFKKSELKKINNIFQSNNYTKYPKNIKKIITVISKREKINEKCISIHPGIDGCLKAIFESLENNRKIKLNSVYPTYGMIEVYSKLFNFRLKKISENSSFQQNIFVGNPNVIYIANPNSPSGNLLKTQNLIEIVSFCEKNKIYLILDEAYIEFSNQKSFSQYIKKFQYLIILKSYSKTFGLPGIRTGYILSNEGNIKKFGKLKSIYDVSSLSLAVVYFFEKNYSIINNYLNLIKKNKLYIKKICSKNKLKYRITEGNFFYLTFKNKITNKLIKNLIKKKILVKKINEKFMSKKDSSIRITIGSKAQIKNFFNIINKI